MQLQVISVFSLILMQRGAMSMSSAVKHASTKTRYENRLPFEGWDAFGGPPRNGMRPSFVYLVARHGERFPTEQRMQDINSLTEVLKDSAIPRFRNWNTPFTSSFRRVAAGELTARGADEMRCLGERVRSYFPKLLGEDYFPNRYNIVSSQVARAAASAVAFSQACFGNSISNSSVQPVALTMSSMHDDKLLRFFDICPKYADFKVSVEDALDQFQNKHYDELVECMRERLRLPSTTQITREHIQGLWTLCISVNPQHAEDAFDACSLFSSQEIEVMEWIDDTKLLTKRGWPGRIPVQMASPLLQDIYDALGPGRHQQPERKARMLFGHAESLCPLLCLLGLFGSPGEGVEGAHAQLSADEASSSTKLVDKVSLLGRRERTDVFDPDLVVPPKPPLQRKWWGATIAPYAANVFLVVYEPEDTNGTTTGREKVQMIFNEQVVRWDGVMAGSDRDGLLPLDAFMALLKARIEDFHMVCDVDESAHTSSSASSCTC